MGGGSRDGDLCALLLLVVFTNTKKPASQCKGEYTHTAAEAVQIVSRSKDCLTLVQTTQESPEDHKMALVGLCELRSLVKEEVAMTARLSLG